MDFDKYMQEAPIITITYQEWHAVYSYGKSVLTVGNYPASFENHRDWEFGCLTDAGVPILRICVKN